MNNKAHLRPQDYDSNGDIFPMEIVASKCPIEVGGNCPLRLQGEWTDLSTDGRHTGWIACSVCGQEPPNESNLRTNFCSYCGAKMRKEGAEA